MGNAEAQITPAVYSSLRRIASRQLGGERPNHTLQATALVHEAYLKLAGDRARQYNDEVHLLAVASRIMRQVLVDYARSRATQKRLCSPAVDRRSSEPAEDLSGVMELDDALAALAAENENHARLIEMRYFGGMTAEESAAALGISVHVVRHDLRTAQAWLRDRLK